MAREPETDGELRRSLGVLPCSHQGCGDEPALLGSAGRSGHHRQWPLLSEHAGMPRCRYAARAGFRSTAASTFRTRLFAPSIGIAYRPTEKFVIRAGYSLSPYQEHMGIAQMQAYPGEVQLDEIAVNPYSLCGSTAYGSPANSRGARDQQRLPDSPQYGQRDGVNSKKNFVRGYFQSYNFTVQRELPGNLLASLGYVGTHAVHLQTRGKPELRPARRRHCQPAFGLYSRLLHRHYQPCCRGAPISTIRSRPRSTNGFPRVCISRPPTRIRRTSQRPTPAARPLLFRSDPSVYQPGLLHQYTGPHAPFRRQRGL